MMKRIVIILLVFFVFSHGCLAESFFPSTDELFGQTMPSISSVIGREADSEEKKEEGEVYSYLDFSAHDYAAFSKYLANKGCTSEQVSLENKILKVLISKGTGTITFTYDYPNRMATVLYPDNTRKEDMSDDLYSANDDEGVLPDVNSTFGSSCPSMDQICNREPRIILLDTYETKYSYTNVTESEYNSFCCYLTEMNCTLVDSDFDGKVLNATVKKGDSSFRIKYNNSTKTLDIIYPEAFYIENAEYEDSSSAIALLPTTNELFGVFMPRIDLATGLEATSKVQLEDGGYEEVYSGFTDSDYQTFSNYLQKYGCEVLDYGTNENGVLSITLTKSDMPFTLLYDRAASQVTIRYSSGTRLEPTPIPSPTPKLTPVPTTKPISSTNYSENDCYSVAADYLKSVLKNPNSLQIHSHSTINYDDTYCFVFDYSAQNSFGGYTRSNAYIWITKATKSVYWSDFK